MKLIEYLKNRYFISVTKIIGPDGAYISAKKRKMHKQMQYEELFPIDKCSQNGRLNEYRIITLKDGSVIATINDYIETETLSLGEE